MKMASDRMLFQSKLTFDTASEDVEFVDEPPSRKLVNVGLHARSMHVHYIAL